MKNIGDICFLKLLTLNIFAVMKNLTSFSLNLQLLKELKKRERNNFLRTSFELKRCNNSRLFSGDETGKIIVHDFFNVDPKVVEQRTKEREAKKPRLELETALDEANNIAIALKDSNGEVES